MSDVVIVPAGASEKTDDVLFSPDRLENQSIEIYAPYTLPETNRVVFGEIFGTPGKSTVFPKM